ncbi:MAG: hypothetical protein JW384_01719 [Nitrosomonadaceae bacterium]|nr:hypothetical protein [Nitrosomonadaceae bacterium]
METPPLERYMTIAAQLKSQHRQRTINADMYKRLYHKDHWELPPADEADYQVTLPVHTIVVNTAHAILTGMKPTIRVYPNDSSSSRQQETADRIERWHSAVDHENVVSQDTDEWDSAVFNQILTGVGVLREVYNFPRGWYLGDKEVYDLPRYPIVQQSLDPCAVFWEWGNPPRGRFSRVFYEVELSVNDIETLFDVELPSRKDKNGDTQPKDYFETRNLTDFWEWRGTDIYHCIFVNSNVPDDTGDPLGMFIKRPVKMPEYWNIPYHIFPFFETTSKKYDEWGISILFALTDIPHYMEILSSRKMRLAEMYADPIIIAEENENSEPIQISKQPGSVLHTQHGERVAYLQWQGSAPDDRYLWEKFDDIMHELMFSRTLMAQGSADATGFRTALDRETSLLKIAKGLESYQNARMRCYSARAYAIGKFSADVKLPARGIDIDDGRFVISIKGAEITKYRDIIVEIKPQFPGDKQREVAVATAAIAAKLWDVDEGREYIQVRNKKKIKDGQLRDQIENHPMYIEHMVTEFLTDLDKKKQGDAIPGDQAPAAPGGGGGPPGGLPGLPGMPGLPGQPAGANPASPQTAGLDNRLRPGARPEPVGTVTPSSLTAAIAAGKG